YLYFGKPAERTKSIGKPGILPVFYISKPDNTIRSHNTINQHYLIRNECTLIRKTIWNLIFANTQVTPTWRRRVGLYDWFEFYKVCIPVRTKALANVIRKDADCISMSIKNNRVCIGTIENFFRMPDI